ncbi:hypothetical protein [Uliginosibacterium gangwonense]|uniref:hypothetical protein n=1 Tax=Uliginosibacterium gangwonense TaxID=392736 RepID=UPI00035C269A|nr:hypothetical protein [Uliginosibacterium gangwonense]
MPQHNAFQGEGASPDPLNTSYLWQVNAQTLLVSAATAREKYLELHPDDPQTISQLQQHTNHIQELLERFCNPDPHAAKDPAQICSLSLALQHLRDLIQAMTSRSRGAAIIYAGRA